MQDNGRERSDSASDEGRSGRGAELATDFVFDYNDVTKLLYFIAGRSLRLTLAIKWARVIAPLPSTSNK